MADIPQFFQNQSPLRSDWARYNLASQGAKPASILIECVAGQGTLPKDASAAASGIAQLDFEREFHAVAQVANSALDALRAMKITEGSIEFGVEMGGEMGIPLITKGEARANFKVTLVWKDPKSGS